MAAELSLSLPPTLPSSLALALSRTLSLSLSYKHTHANHGKKDMEATWNGVLGSKLKSALDHVPAAAAAQLHHSAHGVWRPSPANG